MFNYQLILVKFISTLYQNDELQSNGRISMSYYKVNEDTFTVLKLNQCMVVLLTKLEFLCNLRMDFDVIEPENTT